MKILLIGLGSIGQRHLTNLLHLGYTDVSVVSRAGVLPDSFSRLTCYASVDDALQARSFDAAIICSPTALHLASLFPLLRAQVPNIYIEKPVSHNLEGLDELVRLATSYTNNIVVGYDLHFDPGMQKVKELLDQNVIGKIVSVNAQVGQYLPDWRPQQDYREGMSAKKETGGGVMLDLVHEFDYLYWLFGPAENICCQYTNSGALEIETEDVCEVLIRFSNGAIGTIHLDYLQQKMIRNCMITGHNGSIFWDLSNCRVSWINKNKQETQFEYVGFNRNDRFIESMQSFLSGAEDPRLTSLAEGLESLRWVVAAKYSAEHNSFVNPNTFKTEQFVK
ncbi:Gfo/Idh/MocA family protein [Aridibaculum aurantiacum]|uniref:Gfo/Idh/MocA family protein n=1 Tax=Aridibaculum aurantiacum TaxID=2810307 RepID=UPI001A95B790|nr:Gfo/Idh/MocA family oxidoreductase [Aridibaculum aurantiacum]